MRVLDVNELILVSGGSSHAGSGGDKSGNNYGDTNNKPSFPQLLGSGLGGLAGNTLGGPVGGMAGSIAGAYAGYYIENIDYNQMGENYKNYVHHETQNGNYMAD
ncbi:MAG: hypothetical protein Q4G13_04740 [Moraxella sp.]|nr:hypothetical protein [Moraxella sp.]